MGEVFFYHLTRRPLEAVLPPLLEKSLAAGWRVELRGTEAARMDWLDEKLWLVPEESFLPHGRAGGARDAEQPVLLTLGPGQGAGREALIAIDGAEIDPAEVAGLARASLVFDGGDTQALAAARAQWTQLVAAGLPARYWSEESGRWKERAQRNLTA